MLDVFTVNAWLLERRIKSQLGQQDKIVPLLTFKWLLERRIKSQLGQQDKIVPLLTFKTNLAEQLCNRGVVKAIRIGRPRSSSRIPKKKEMSRNCAQREKPQAIWLFEYVDQYHLMDVTNSIMTITSLVCH
ncbi:hypothetical protein QE152_g30927 [Popillia japonica]|uniref:Uncharacterized protein n=1 Tax=Popillia japonica TaxID=7064 RepID=A0AAW1JD78_POPJA